MIDTETNEVVAEIEVGKEPTGVAITPDGKLAYVVNFGDGTVSYNTSATHSYATPGVYAVTAKVTDNYGATATSSPIAIVSPAKT